MRNYLLAVLMATGCVGDYWAAPRGPRSVCSSSAVAAGNRFIAYGTGYSECEQVPADHCWNSDSEQCTEEAARRNEHNEEVHEQYRHSLTALAIVGAMVVGVVVVACFDGSCEHK